MKQFLCRYFSFEEKINGNGDIVVGGSYTGRTYTKKVVTPTSLIWFSFAYLIEAGITLGLLYIIPASLYALYKEFDLIITGVGFSFLAFLGAFLVVVFLGFVIIVIMYLLHTTVLIECEKK